MACPICGSKVPEGSSKCPVCGTELLEKGEAKIGLQTKRDEKKPLSAELLGLSRLKKEAPPPKRKSWEDVIGDLEKEYGRDDDGVFKVPETQYDEEALKELMLIPGVTRERAKLLYDIGFSNLESVLIGALHGYKDAEALARIMAIKIKVGKRGEISQMRVKCTSCRTLVRVTQERCPVCGNPIGSLTLSEDDVKKKIEQHAGNVLKAVSEDAFFRGIDASMRKEIITEMKDLVPEEVKRRERLKQEWRIKLGRWKARGFAVDELSQLLDSNFDEFLARGKELLPPKKAAAPGKDEKAGPKDEVKAKKEAAVEMPVAAKAAGWCTLCGAKWPSGADKCPACAGTLGEMRRCPNCGISLKKAMKRCPGCKKGVGGTE